MQISDAPVSLADLSAAGIRLRPEEAATLVRELALQVAHGEVAGVPSAHVIRLSSSGSISVEGPVAAGGRSVVRAAQLLDALLSAPEGGSQHRVPGGLKLVLARGLGTLDLPPFASLAVFADALSRFAAPDPAAVVAGLVRRWAELVAARPDEELPDGTESLLPQMAQVELFAPAEGTPARTSAPAGSFTISDIRRARRAAGLSLAQVAERSRIPVGLLRQLEWGYLLNWPSGPRGGDQLTRYARASGLDEHLVTAAVAPLIEQTATLRALFAGHAARPESVDPPAALRSDSRNITDAVRVADARPAKPTRQRSSALALLAVPALLTLAVLPAWWAHSTGRLDAPQPAAERSVEPGFAWENEPEAVERQRGAGHAAQPGQHPASSEPDEGLPVRSGVPPRQSARPPLAVEDSGSGVVRQNADRAPEPAAGVRDRTPSALPPTGGRDLYPPPPSVGTAMFHQAAAGNAPTAVAASGRGAPGSVLRVTRIVGDSANNSPVRPSPDGHRITFDSDRDGERGVYVADADGRNVRRVSPAGFAAMPSWSPDGRTLAFVRAEPGQPDVWNLWTLELGTGALRQVTRRAQGQPRGGSWFPEGGRIAYTLEDQLVIHDLHADDDRVFPSPRKGSSVRTPVVSPDGRRIVFHVQRDGTWLLDLADGSMRRVLDDPTADEYVWSPDGTQLAYHSSRSGGWGLWVLAPR